MSEEIKHTSIRLLPAQLANQIAAGEVIERPASVVKELIENALDADATRLDVELTGGGMDGICVTDDGHGIAYDELKLAISRHATSKISELDDLLTLTSLGFRGEALASICSVSQWELTSRTRDQAQDQPQDQHSAAQLKYDAGLQVIPANHPVGTTVLINRLFYNTPARRKFLRAERTEFRHCDDVIRRMALARFDVGFFIKHNSRQVHRLPIVTDDIGQSRRVAQLCGEVFIKNARVIDFPRRDMRLWGWLSQPEFSRQQTDLQFFYINGRIISDRIINHAVRLAYQSLLPTGRHAAYVLHLELDPSVVDVNVHPTKHEVRFRESRLIHDFITRSLREGLQQALNYSFNHDGLHDESGSHVSDSVAYKNNHAMAESATHYPKNGLSSRTGQKITILHDSYALIQQQDQVLLADIPKTQSRITRIRWQQGFQAGDLKTQPLLIPETLTLSSDQQNNYNHAEDLLKQLGFDITRSGPAEIVLRGVPVLLQGYKAKELIYNLLEKKTNENEFDKIESCLGPCLDLTRLDCDLLVRGVGMFADRLHDCIRPISANDLASLLNKPTVKS